MAKKQTSKTSSKKGSSTKSKSILSQASTVYKNWKEQIFSTDVTTINFNYETIFIVESDQKCFTIVDDFITFTESINQSKIRLISGEHVVNTSTGAKAHKNLGLLAPIAKKAVHDAKTEIKKNGIISTELEALIIKLMILVIRNQYLNHKENYNELQNALEEEYNNLLSEETDKKAKKGKKGKTKAAKPAKADKPAKGKKSKKGSKKSVDNCETINTVSFAAVTEIRKKMKSLKQSEDFIGPEEGVDLYFAFAKVYNYDLIEELQKVGVKITALVDMSASDKEFSTSVYHKTPFESELSINEVRQIDISNFWRACGIAKGNILFNLPIDTCYMRYCPQHNESSDVVYEDMIRIVKNLTDLRRLHVEYLLSLKVLDVSESKPPIKVWCMKMYNKILNKVPNEFQSIPVILHALIEEVVVLVSDDKDKEDNVKIASKKLDINSVE